jgi:opacity protein-like surface antigen
MRIIFFALLVLSSSLEAAPWSGFYTGGHLGGWINHTKLESNHVAFSNWQGTCNHHINASSALLGAQAGYLYPVKNNWILGLEGDFSYFFSQSQSVQCDCDLEGDIYDYLGLRSRNQGSIRGRLAYQLNSAWLTYFTAGASFANLGASYSNEVNDQYQASQIQPGWIVGGGLEWSFASKWSLRFEYLYANYNTLKMALPSIYGIQDSFGRAEFDLSSMFLRAGINYWLN